MSQAKSRALRPKKFSFRFLLFVFVGSLSGSLTACGGNPRNTSIRVQPHEVNANGCLSLEMLLVRLHDFPAEVTGDLYTEDLRVSPAGDARPELVPLLARGAFRMESGLLTDLTQFDLLVRLDSAVQRNCESVQLVGAASRAVDYRVLGSSASSISLEQGDSGQRIEITLLSPQSLSMRTIYPALDMCNNQRKAFVDTTQFLEWGNPKHKSTETVEVTAEMLIGLSASVLNVPEEVSTLLATGVTTGQVEVTRDALLKLRDTPVRSELHSCPSATRS